MNAYATYTTQKIIRNGRKAIKVILDVESDRGWLGGCVLFASSTSEGQTMAYNEADRRAIAHGLLLQSLKAA